jgi:P-type Cu+ transporter
VENAMTKAEDEGGAVAGSTCGCAPTMAASPAEETVNHAQHNNDKAGTVDPVCGMSVEAATSRHRFDYRGETYHFCSAGCRTRFSAQPEQYLGKNKPDSSVQEGAIYTCPMHPQIRQVGPGSCPICGMALEPEIASLETPPNPELADMTRRFWIGLVLALPPFVLEMGGHLAGGHGWIDQTMSNWIQLGFATPVVLWAGWPFFVRGWRSLVTRNLNMFTLIAMGTGVAYVYSVVGTIAPDIFPPTFRGHGGAVAVYFEAAAVITVLVLLGQVLDLRAREAMAPTTRSRSIAWRSATNCGFGPEKKCLLMASSSKAAPRSMNPL